jgi:shikimate kinase
MPNINLVGFMGTGKTTVGKALARLLGYTFVDADDEIEREQGRSISSIFAEDGEPEFRRLEREMLQRLSSRDGLVVSAGGGAVIDPNNVENMRSGGPVICLTATPKAIYERVRHSTHRPLLDTPDPMGRIVELLEARAGFYARADSTIDTTGRSVDEVVKAVLTAAGMEMTDNNG